MSLKGGTNGLACALRHRDSRELDGSQGSRFDNGFLKAARNQDEIYRANSSELAALAI
jgi:hypothetical protein